MGRVLDVTSNPNATVEDLARVINMDPALATRVLRCANCTSNALRYPASTVEVVVRMLGFVTLRNITVSALVCDLFQDWKEIGRYARHELWRHMVSVAS